MRRSSFVDNKLDKTTCNTSRSTPVVSTGQVYHEVLDILLPSHDGHVADGALACLGKDETDRCKRVKNITYGRFLLYAHDGESYSPPQMFTVSGWITVAL
jgi:hypothetical protein